MLVTARSVASICDENARSRLLQTESSAPCPNGVGSDKNYPSQNGWRYTARPRERRLPFFNRELRKTNSFARRDWPILRRTSTNGPARPAFRRRSRVMKDYQASVEKLRKDAAEAALIRLATDGAKRDVFNRLYEPLNRLAEVE